MKLSIVTPESILFTGEISEVSLPTPDGEITVLPHHIPLISIVVPGVIRIRENGKEQFFAVSRGVIEIDGGNVRVLADTADRAEDLEEAAIEKAKEKAEALMKEKHIESEEFAEATAALARELARLKTIRRHRTHSSRPMSN